MAKGGFLSPVRLLFRRSGAVDCQRLAIFLKISFASICLVESLSRLTCKSRGAWQNFLSADH
jgi:hypothetical protein